MENDLIPLLAAALVTLTSLALMVASDWRISIALLVVQYVGVFALTTTQWPLGMAVTKLVAGWMSGAVLGIALISLAGGENARPQPASDGNLDKPNRMGKNSGLTFFILAAMLAGLAIYSQVPNVMRWFKEMPVETAWGGLVLIGMGLLKLGFSDQILPTILGLLTALAGFEILYASVQASLLVTAFLAGIDLGLALVGAYLLLAPSMEETE